MDLAHKDGRMTARYSHLSDDYLKTALNAVNPGATRHNGEPGEGFSGNKIFFAGEITHRAGPCSPLLSASCFGACQAKYRTNKRLCICQKPLIPLGSPTGFEPGRASINASQGRGHVSFLIPTPMTK
jgi:hypothetical protein